MRRTGWVNFLAWFRWGFLFFGLWAELITSNAAAADRSAGNVDQDLRETLSRNGFTGKVEWTLRQRLGRRVDPAKAELGRLLCFDKFVGLHGDNSCAGCHSPLNGFGDSQSIAIGVENNGFVGPRRAGPRNQRRTPSVVNTAFYPRLMWNGRFSALSGDPFDNSKVFLFPAPEGTTQFPPNDPSFKHLLQAQAHIPPTELSEAAGFTGVCDNAVTFSRFQTKSADGARLVKEAGSADMAAVFDPLAGSAVKVFQASSPNRNRLEPDFCRFDVPAIGRTGVRLPPPARIERPDAGFDEFRNEPIRDVVLGRLYASEAYRAAFNKAFPDLQDDQAITFAMFGQAIAEFEFLSPGSNCRRRRVASSDNPRVEPKKVTRLLLF